MFLIMFFQQLIGASSHVAAKLLSNAVEPTVVLLFRASFAVLFYWTFSLVRKSGLRRVDRADIPLILLLSLLNIPINQYLFLYAIKFTTAPNSALAYAMTPVFVLILGKFIYGEKVTPLKTLGIATAFAGVVLVLSEKGLSFESEFLYGNILMLLATFAWALYTSLGKKISVKYGAVYANTLTMSVGLAMFLPVYLINSADYPVGSITLESWGWILFLGTVVSGMGYILYYYALKRFDTGKVAVFNNIQPVFTALFSVVAFNSEFSALFIVGGLITLAGVLLTQRG